MPCDALTYNFCVQELANTITGGKIDKITMPMRDEVYLHIRNKGKNYFLVICAGNFSRIHLTSSTKPSPTSAYSFCMNLRKNILGGSIVSILKQEDERVIMLDIAFLNELGVREDKRLICEIMGKYSNIILTDLNFKIYECLKHIPLDSLLNRPLLPNFTYTLPTQNKLSPLDCDGIANAPYSADELCKKIKGLAPVSFYEAVYNTNASNSNKMIANELKKMFIKPTNPCVLIKNNKIEDFFIRPYNSLSGEYRFFNTLNDAMDYYYCNKDAFFRLENRAKSLGSLVNSAIKRTQKRINELSLSYQSALNFEEDKLKGDLIMSNIYKIKQGDKELIAQNFYSKMGEEVKIKLDDTLSPAQNAQKFYKVYAKKKRTISIQSQMLKKSKIELSGYEQLLEEIKQAKDLSELDDTAEQMLTLKLIKSFKREKNSPISTPHRFEIDGFVVFAGKNSTQNERLTKDCAPNDIWLHTKNYRGSHVVIRSLNKKVPEQVILASAQIAAFYSKASAGDKVEVDYCLAKHVSKPSGSALGFVTYKNHNTIIVSPKSFS